LPPDAETVPDTAGPNLDQGQGPLPRRSAGSPQTEVSEADTRGLAPGTGSTGERRGPIAQDPKTDAGHVKGTTRTVTDASIGAVVAGTARRKEVKGEVAVGTGRGVIAVVVETTSVETGKEVIAVAVLVQGLSSSLEIK